MSGHATKARARPAKSSGTATPARPSKAVRDIIFGSTAKCPDAPKGYQPVDPQIASGSLCRGACGADCHPNACSPIGYETYGNCQYEIIECGSHPVCQWHDVCYDVNAENGDTYMGRRNCDKIVWDNNKYKDIKGWMDGRGPQTKTLKFAQLVANKDRKIYLDSPIKKPKRYPYGPIDGSRDDKEIA